MAEVRRRLNFAYGHLFLPNLFSCLLSYFVLLIIRLSGKLAYLSVVLYYV